MRIDCCGVPYGKRSLYWARRQAVPGPYFVDFCCFSRRLVIEVDGSQHGSPIGQAADAERTLYVEQHGHRVLRFWNVQIFNEIGGVLDTIPAALSDPHH